MRKKRLLVVAPGLPEFDRNAGSRRLYSWLRILATEYDIAFYMLHRRIGGDSKRYAQALTALGVKIHAPQETVLELLARQIDHGVLFEFFHTAERLLPYMRLLRPDLPMVVSCADLHYVRESRAAVYADHPVRAKARAGRTRRRELGTYRRADMVVTVTEDDRRALLRAAPDTITSAVPTACPVARDVPAFLQRMPCSILFVGGFRHAPNADAVLFFYRHVLPLVRRSLRDVALTIVGDAPPREVLALSSAEISVTDWVPAVEPYLASHRVSIAPLRFGAGLKGKIVEAMAAGLPVVTTPVGAEGMELVHGSTALIAESPEAFARAVVRLCTDHDLHARLSRNGLEHARARWDPTVVAPKLLETLARMPTLRTKRLRAVDRVLVRARATYDSSGVPARFTRLSSLRRWYCGRLREVLTRGIR
jgi:glycosyltransferase involved in cell wall biosynthesis